MNALHEIDTLLYGDDSPVEAGDQIVTSATVADWLGISAQRVGGLARLGHIPRRADGRYNLRDAVRGYARFARDAAEGRRGSEELATEKLRLAREGADKLAIQNAKAKGELLEAAAVAREWASILRDVRAAILAAPSRIGSRLPHLTAHDVAEINRELSDALADLAEGNDHERA